MSSGTLFPGVVVPRSDREHYRRLLQTQILQHGLYRGTVHADHVLAECPVPENVHPNAVGLAFSTLLDANLIEPVGFQRSERRARHKGISRLWRVCDAQGARQYLKALASTETTYERTQ